MYYKLNNKNIRIPDEVIKNSMKVLELTEQEAIQMYLEDEGYLENTEVEELTKKAKENKTDKIINRENVENKKVTRERKENPLKETIILNIYDKLKEIQGITALKIENKAKIITFSLNNEDFKIDLVQKRKKKEEK